jgi:hypothetical protein
MAEAMQQSRHGDDDASCRARHRGGEVAHFDDLRALDPHAEALRDGLLDGQVEVVLAEERRRSRRCEACGSHPVSFGVADADEVVSEVPDLRAVADGVAVGDETLEARSTCVGSGQDGRFAAVVRRCARLERRAHACGRFVSVQGLPLLCRHRGSVGGQD